MTEKQFCRCCLSVKCCKSMSVEYDNGETKEIYAQMLLKTYNINVENSSYNSCFICDTCIIKLRNAAMFKAQVLKAQETILGGWDSLKNDLQIELNDIEEFEERVDHFRDSDFVWDVETCKEPGQVILIKLQSNQDQKYKENISDVNDIVNVSKKESTNSNLKKRILPASAIRGSEKLLKTKSVTNSKKSNVKVGRKSVKTVRDKSKTTDEIYNRHPITQPEIDARENTRKLIQNSNLCLFRSLKTKFGCFMCKASFVETTKLREHSSTHTNTSLLAYRVSKWRGLSFKNADISDLKCKHCTEEIHTLNELINHLYIEHNIVFFGSNHLLIPYRLDEENQCALCELKFNTFLRLSMHMNSHYKNNVCEICGLSFINRLSLRMHFHSQHREKKCSFCPAKFLTVSSKTKHLNKVHNVFYKKRYCNLCEKTFPYTYMLNKHKFEEHGAKKIVVVCNECGKKFFHEANLRVHIRSVHIKERNYPCDVCGTRFFTKCDQKRHEKTHNDVRSFSCNYCDAKLKSKDSWRRHMRRQHGHVFT